MLGLRGQTREKGGNDKVRRKKEYDDTQDIAKKEQCRELTKLLLSVGMHSRVSVRSHPTAKEQLPPPERPR